MNWRGTIQPSAACLLAPPIHGCPTCNIHSPISTSPRSQSIPTSILGPKSHLNLISVRFRWDSGYAPSWGKFLSVHRPVKLKNKLSVAKYNGWTGVEKTFSLQKGENGKDKGVTIAKQVHNAQVKFHYLFIFFKYLYWSIITLHCCVSCRCTTKWINYTYTYIPISPPSCVSLPPSLSHPSRWSQSTELISLCYVAASHQLSILHLVVYI